MRSSSPRASGFSSGLAGGKQHFRLEHEAVADDAHVLAVAEDLAQAAEEIGAVARQLLHPLRQRHVEPGAEIGDAGLAVLVAVLRRARASSSAASWRRMAAICWFRTSTWFSARPVACRSVSSALFSSSAPGSGRRRRYSTRPCRRARSASARLQGRLQAS